MRMSKKTSRSEAGRLLDRLETVACFGYDLDAGRDCSSPTTSLGATA